MKQAIYKKTIFFPIMLMLYVFMEPISYSVPEIGLYLEPSMARLVIVMGTITWLCCSPLQKSCCNGTFTELLFYLVPLEIVLMVEIAQWYFIVFVILIVCMLVAETALFLILGRHKHQNTATKKYRRMYKTFLSRCFVLITALFCSIPCFVTIFVYRFQSPSYQADQELLDQILSEATEENFDTGSKEGDSYQKNAGLWRCFQPSKWEDWTVYERISIMQKLADFESEVLGIPPVPVKAGLIGEFTLGEYRVNSNEIWIHTGHLAESSTKDSIEVLCHEIHHYYQNYLISNLDWENPAMQTAYFKELRTWLQNQKHYRNANVYGFDRYQNQPLEISARNYATEETSKIIAYIENQQQ